MALKYKNTNLEVNGNLKATSIEVNGNLKVTSNLTDGTNSVKVANIQDKTKFTPIAEAIITDISFVTFHSMIDFKVSSLNLLSVSISSMDVDNEIDSML